MSSHRFARFPKTGRPTGAKQTSNRSPDNGRDYAQPEQPPGKADRPRSIPRCAACKMHNRLRSPPPASFNTGFQRALARETLSLLYSPSSIQLSFPEGKTDNSLNAYPRAHNPPTMQGNRNSKREAIMPNENGNVSASRLVGSDRLITHHLRRLLGAPREFSCHPPCNIPEVRGSIGV